MYELYFVYMIEDYRQSIDSMVDDHVPMVMIHVDDDQMLMSILIW
jgi:hypothetical protein